MSFITGCVVRITAFFVCCCVFVSLVCCCVVYFVCCCIVGAAAVGVCERTFVDGDDDREGTTIRVKG